MRSLIAAASVLATVTVLSGCSATSGCGAGYVPIFNLSVASSANPELSVRFCADGKCSPIPRAGKIPAYLTDPTDDHGSFVRHLSRGEWSIRPELPTPPRTGVVTLYRDGVHVASRQIRLNWPRFNPCAASNPPAPHPTVHPT